jgi:hypothetical protein
LLELLKNDFLWIPEKRNQESGVSKLKQSWFELDPIQEPIDQGGVKMDEAAPCETLSATKVIQKVGLSVQAPSSPNNDNVVHQIMKLYHKRTEEWSLEKWYLMQQNGSSIS